MPQNLTPSFPWIAPPHPPPWCNPRKGRDQTLLSGNPTPASEVSGLGIGGARSVGRSVGSDRPISPATKEDSRRSRRGRTSMRAGGQKRGKVGKGAATGGAADADADGDDDATNEQLLSPSRNIRLHYNLKCILFYERLRESRLISSLLPPWRFPCNLF